MVCVKSKGLSMQRSIQEIGSEFWIEQMPETLIKERDGVYAISGRTAIDLILQDILRKWSAKSVAMPAWCCDSMVAPFVTHGIEVWFYDDGHTDLTDYTDILYVTNYFGYENTFPLKQVRQFKEGGSIIIYDRTHSFLMNDEAYNEVADYSFASIRKWMGVVGGAVVFGLSQEPKLNECPYICIKERAMRDKYSYLMGESGVKKEEFLAAFGEFVRQLSFDYCNYEMDNLSYTLYKQTNQRAMRERRLENAAYIHENLKGVQLMYSLSENAAPLFVPVLFETKEQRDYVRKKLIEQQIYCPVHWPQPKQIPTDYKVNDIVSRELSLICDQRYGITEMKRETETIMQLI